MTTESRELFDLCRSVYKATGWTGTNQVIGIYYQISEVDVKYGIFDRSEKRKEPVDTPLYTSDYLLERLPVGTNISKTNTNTTEPSIYYSATCRNNGIHHGGTPLQALLKLTLKLYEEGLL